MQINTQKNKKDKDSLLSTGIKENKIKRIPEIKASKVTRGFPGFQLAEPPYIVRI